MTAAFLKKMLMIDLLIIGIATLGCWTLSEMTAETLSNWLIGTAIGFFVFGVTFSQSKTRSAGEFLDQYNHACPGSTKVPLTMNSPLGILFLFISACSVPVLIAVTILWVEGR